MAEERKTRLVTAPDADKLDFRRLDARDALGELFSAHVELVSSDPSIELENWLGQPLVVEIELRDGQRRHYGGLIAAASQLGTKRRHAIYRAQLVPWLWMLDRTANCRVYQQKTIPEIIKSVFSEHGYSADVDDKLADTYAKLDYCVQYRETDFAFVSRLMDHEGIYYFFRHEAGRHVLVLLDGPEAHEDFPGYETLPYRVGDSADFFEELVDAWTASRNVVSGRYALNDFDFTKPRAALLAQSAMPGPAAPGEHEIYDYPGTYAQVRPEGERLARLRLESLHARQQLVVGEGTARGLLTGSTFTLSDHPRGDQNAAYLVLNSRLDLRAPAYESEAAAEEHFRIVFEAIPAQTPFRKPSLRARPHMPGPQTATIVGPAGEEIWTDEFGRVKVQFHWDRYGQRDENSSCWVRVAQVWAGKGWGGMMIPRVGQEVIVVFLEGDPDRPIITGSVYNTDNMPPFPLPDNKTHSGWRSRSTKSGGRDHFNELRFDDTIDNEEVFLHAQKDLRIEVENDMSCHVERDQSTDVDRDRRIEVKRDLTSVIGEQRSIEVGKDDKLDVKAHRAVSVARSDELTAGDSITLECGQSKIVLDSGGKISITCMNLEISATSEVKIDGMALKFSGSTSVSIKSGVNLQLEGLQTKVQATMLDLSASALAKLKGGMTMLG